MNTSETDKIVNENNCDIEKTKQAISDLYKNVTMAQSCIKTLLPYVREDDVVNALHAQVEKYDRYIEEIGTVGKNLNFDPTPAPKAAVGMADMGIKMKMLADKTTTHVATIMLKGTLNGVIDLCKMRREQDVHPDVAALENRILRFEECRLEEIKQWL